jgi:hypothetical protein
MVIAIHIVIPIVVETRITIGIRITYN